MKRNWFGKRMVVMAILALALALLPNTVLAAGEHYTVEGGTLGQDYTYTSKTLTFLKGGEYTIKMADGVTKATDYIKINASKIYDDTKSITLNLSGLNMERTGTNDKNIEIINSVAGNNIDINLVVDGTNVITNTGYYGYCIYQDKSKVSASIKISGNGTLTLNKTENTITDAKLGNICVNSFTLDSPNVTVVLKNTPIYADNKIRLKEGTLNIDLQPGSNKEIHCLSAKGEFLMSGGSLSASTNIEKSACIHVSDEGTQGTLEGAGIQITGGNATLTSKSYRFGVISIQLTSETKKGVLISDGTVKIVCNHSTGGSGIVMNAKNSNFTMAGGNVSIDVKGKYGGTGIFNYNGRGSVDMSVSGGEIEIITEGNTSHALQYVTPITFDGHYLHRNYAGSTKANRAAVADDNILSDNISKQYLLIKPAYKITYNIPDGSSLPTDIPKAYTEIDGDITITQKATRTGYSFSGWLGHNGEAPTTPTTPLVIPAGSTGDKVFDSAWNPNTYTVYFYSNNPSNRYESQGFTYGTKQALNDNPFTYDGYAFLGWNTVGSPTTENPGTFYSNKEEVLNLTSENNGHVDLWAQWKIIQYDVRITPGTGMTKTGTSGAAEQTGLTGAMTAVVYSADDGYYFPEDYAVAPVNGIFVTRIDYSQIKVSGSPTADASITLTAATAKTKEATPGAEFEATGADCGTLTKVTSGMKYSIDGGTTWTDITDTTAAIASGVNTTNGIQVYQPGNGTTTVDSDTQTITVTKAATPNLAATQPATIGGKGSIPTTTEYQQSTDGTAWTDCTGAWSDLAAGTYYVRVKATGTTLASDAQEITISAYDPGKEPTPSAAFTATGADSGTLTNVTSGMKYSIDGGTTWTDITDTTAAIASGVNTTNGIQVYQPGNGTTTTDSDAQTITVTKAATPNLAATQPATIGGKGSIPTTTNHQQSTDGTTWTDCTGAWSDLAAGTYYVRVKPSGATLASDAQEITISAYDPGKETTPSATFTATGADSGTLTNVTSGMKYSIDGGTTWTDITDTTAAIPSGVNTTNGIQVYQPGNGTTTVDSDTQTITVTKAATPNLAATQPATIGGKGSIPTTTNYQQSTDGTTWTDCTGAWSDLAAGTYYVRVKPSGATLASDAQTITISEYTPGKETTPSATFTATGADCGTLTNVTSGMKYSIDGGTTWIDIGDTTVTIASGVNTTNGIQVVKSGNGTTTTDSDAQTITVTKAATPNLAATQPATIGGKGSIPTTTNHQQSTDGTTWTDCTGAWSDLAAGTYYVRVKATGTTLASDAQEITISAYDPGKETTPSATFTATGADCGTLTNVTSGMKYSIDGGTTWIDIGDTTVTIASGVNTTNGIQVVKSGNGTTTVDSDKQTITVTKAATPNLAATQPATIGGKGSIPTTTEYQQSTDGTAWTDCTGAWSDLAAGTYYVRVKPSGATLASDAQTITISEYTPGKEPTPSAIFTATGTDTGTLSGLIDGAEYTLSGASPASFTASGTAQELTGVSPGTLLLVKKGNGLTTSDSDPQSITVTKAAAPTAPTAVNCTTADNNDGKLVGITAAMEYKKSDADTWTAGTGNDITGLVPGTYYVRVKAAGATLASDNQEISIAEYTAPEQVARPTFTPASGTEFTGSGSVEISCTTEGSAIYYTTDETEPTANSTKYTGPIAVSANTTIKAIAVKEGMTDSNVAEAVYTMTILKAYTVTVTNDGHGTGIASPNSGYEGTEVLLTAYPAEGYKFKEWQVVSGGVTITDNKFNIGTENVEIKAVFEAQATGWHKGEAQIQPGAPELQSSNMQEVAESVIAAIQNGEIEGISEEVRQAVSQPDARVLLLLIISPLSQDQIPAEDWAALQKLQEEAGYTGIVPFDMTLVLKVNDQTVAEIHETKIPVKFSVGIMENLLGTPRQFTLVNVHNGTAKVIPTTRRGNFLDGESTEFSTYAIAYKDGETPTDTPTATPTVTPTVTPTTAPTSTPAPVIDPTRFDDVAVPSDSFTFRKVWQGDSEKSIDFTLYKQGGTVYHHGFDKKIVSRSEWKYNAWFSGPVACYVIEKPIPGYQTKYENVGVYAQVTDRCCDGGTIINKKIPKTGDEEPLLLWAGMIALGAVGLTSALVIGKKRKARK